MHHTWKIHSNSFYQSHAHTSMYFFPLTNHPTWVERTIIAYSQNNVYVYTNPHTRIIQLPTTSKHNQLTRIGAQKGRKRERQMEEEHAHLEWNHSTGVSKHPSRQFFSQLCSRRSNFQESNIRLPAPTRVKSHAVTHSLFPSLNVIFNVRFKYTPRYVILEWNDSRTPTRHVFLFSFFFSLTRNRDSSARITITLIRLERRTAINAGSTHTEPFYARSLA